MVVASHPSIKAGPIQPTPLPLIPDDSSPVSHHSFSTPPERLVTRSTPSSTVHSRETSTVRGGADLSALAPSSSQPQHSRRGNSHSKSPEPSAGRSGLGYDVGLERRPSNSYGHHRNTSIVHGIQHSRNPSFAASTTSTSPLSPELIASLGRGGAPDPEGTGAVRMEQHEGHSGFQGQGANGAAHSLQGTLSTIEDRDTDDVADGNLAGTAHRRMNSNGKPWQERSHSRSHSRHHFGAESKTVGEYALHHLFNSVSVYTRFAELDPAADSGPSL